MFKHAFRNLLVCFDKQLNVNDILDGSRSLVKIVSLKDLSRYLLI